MYPIDGPPPHGRTVRFRKSADVLTQPDCHCRTSAWSDHPNQSARGALSPHFIRSGRTRWAGTLRRLVACSVTRVFADWIQQPRLYPRSTMVPNSLALDM